LPHQVERRLLNAREAAAYLGVSLYTLKKIEYAGYLRPYRTPGGHRRYSQEMLDNYLENSTRFLYRTATMEGAGLGSRQHSESGEAR